MGLLWGREGGSSLAGLSNELILVNLGFEGAADADGCDCAGGAAG